MILVRSLRLILFCLALVSCAKSPTGAASLSGGCSGASAFRGILNGSSDDGCRFSNVLAIEIQAGGGTTALCSGTVISTTAILTAGHCVRDPELGNISRIVVHAPNGSIDVRDVRVHPGFRLSSESAGVDIAILLLSRAVSGVAVAKLSRAIPGRGTDATAVGFGEDGRGADGRGGIGTRLVGAMSVVKYVPYDQALPAGERRPGLTTEPRDSRGNQACQGDSGGPLLVGAEVAAVLSGGEYSRGDDRCVNAVNSVYTPVAPFLGWIQQQI